MAVEEGANQIAAKERKERKDKSATARSRKSAKTLLTNYCLPLTYAFHQSPFTNHLSLPVPMPDLTARYEFASALIKDAGELALDYFHRLGTLTVKQKGEQDMASEADLNVEMLIRERLRSQFPEDAFLGEETGRTEFSAGQGVWVVDPIDGTQPFISGLAGWCVSVAFVLNGTLEMGLVYGPARGEMFQGCQGQPATLNGNPIKIGSATHLTDGILGVGYSPRVKPDEFLPLFSRLLNHGSMFYREGCGALALCYVAAGRLIGYVEPHINSWDCLGALAVVQAAGGVINDFLADDGLWKGNRVIAGPPSLYPTLVGLF